MLDNGRGLFYYERISAIVFDGADANSAVVIALRDIVSEIVLELTREEAQLFSDLYSRMHYVFDKFQVPRQLRNELHGLRVMAAKLGTKKAVEPDEAKTAGALRATCLLVFHFSSVSTPGELYERYTRFPPLHYRPPRVRPRDVIRHMRVHVLGFTETQIFGNGARRSILSCMSEKLGTISVSLWEQWSELQELAWPYAVVNLFNIQRVSDDEALFSTTAHSLVVLEPDFLVDATEIAECFVNREHNPLLALLRKYTTSSPTEAMMLGNIVNYVFDELLAGPDVGFDVLFNNALRERPLALLPLFRQNRNLLQNLKEQASAHYTTLQKVMPNLRSDMASIEPTFISAHYGLQGRLDLMVEYENDVLRKEVVELKSGKASALNSRPWPNHRAQVACYNLLLDSCFANRSGSSQILYSGAEDAPLRNVPNEMHTKQEVLRLRNQIVAMERALTERKFRHLNSITPGDFGACPSFQAKDVSEFARALRTLGSLENKYFRLFSSFTAREYWAAKTGGDQDNGREGFAGLWRKNTQEKESNYSILAGLQLDVERSDFGRFYLYFQRSEGISPLANFRAGDIVLLYPRNEDGSATPLQYQVLKGSIREIDSRHVQLSLRNKALARSIFRQAREWIVEHDFLPTQFKAMYESLLVFVRAGERKRHLLLGTRRPEFARSAPLCYAGLSAQQNERLSAAVAARDYYLLQGPPGTGKTSRMLKTLVRHLYTESRENIVVLAYTNRAVDEICEALHNTDVTIDFIRLGTPLSTEHAADLLYHAIADRSLEEIDLLVERKRVVVATVATMLNNRELLELKNFTTAIVDEASQILEPHIVGLLSYFERFILIGDEKQLPAVVIQQERGLGIRDQELNGIGIADLRTSLFERLLERCKNQGWHEAYGIISMQGRMHRDIQDFPNTMFYDGHLEAISDWQHHPLPKRNVAAGDMLGKLLATKRLLYWAAAAERRSKVNRTEAHRAAAIVRKVHELYGNDFTADTLGIITPFRAQIACILDALPEGLRELISVDTVERYQGSERDVIILSTAVNHQSELAMIQNMNAKGCVDRKLNVALTRARKQFVLLGVAGVLQYSELYSALVRHIAGHGVHIGADTIADVNLAG